MKLMTKAISRKAQAQFKLGMELDNGPLVVAKLFDCCGALTCYVINQNPEYPDYLWGFAKGYEIEMTTFSLKELEGVRNRLGLGMERDKCFTTRLAIDVWNDLQEGKDV